MLRNDYCEGCQPYERIAELEAENAKLREAAQAVVDAIARHQYPKNKPAIPMPELAQEANALAALLEQIK